MRYPLASHDLDLKITIPGGYPRLSKLLSVSLGAVCQLGGRLASGNSLSSRQRMGLLGRSWCWPCWPKGEFGDEHG